jgi:hypothetical protein
MLPQCHLPASSVSPTALLNPLYPSADSWAPFLVDCCGVVRLPGIRKVMRMGSTCKSAGYRDCSVLIFSPQMCFALRRSVCPVVLGQVIALSLEQNPSSSLVYTIIQIELSFLILHVRFELSIIQNMYFVLFGDLDAVYQCRMRRPQELVLSRGCRRLHGFRNGLSVPNRPCSDDLIRAGRKDVRLRRIHRQTLDFATSDSAAERINRTLTRPLL